MGNQVAVPEQQWMILGHKSLDALESELGRFHNITCDFRERFRTQREPISGSYQALLRAAENILKRAVEEEERSLQSMREVNASLGRRKDPWGAF